MKIDITTIKQRFEIIGSDEKLDLALEKAVRVAPTDISVLITGESGVGKESFPKIIHQFSHRKHANYIAVNCGAIPEGTIDSELFGHEKGSFTGATQTRKGYFEVADGGTIFLDEVGELPMTTQVKLLRVLENKEFIKVGASKAQKTDVRIVAATNVHMATAIKKGKFREDLFYRLSTVAIKIPPLRQRAADIHLIFRKFASDFARKYNMPAVRLDEAAVAMLLQYHFPGNIRQLRNICEEISVFEEERNITAINLKNYLTHFETLPAISEHQKKDNTEELEVVYKILFETRKDLNDLKKLTFELMKSNGSDKILHKNERIIKRIYAGDTAEKIQDDFTPANATPTNYENLNDTAENTIDLSEGWSLQDKELEMIKQALQRNKNKRKKAAEELGISARTLYRKIKQYDL